MDTQRAKDLLKSGRNLIITGEIDSGKTSFCRELAEEYPSLWGGVLSEGILHGGKKTGYRFIHLPTGEGRTALTHKKDFKEDSPGIRFKFMPESFMWAKQLIARDIFEGKRYICIDEVGKLELNRQGFYDSIRPGCRCSEVQYLLVIRSAILQRAIDLFCLDNFGIIRIPQ